MFKKTIFFVLRASYLFFQKHRLTIKNFPALDSSQVLKSSSTLWFFLVFFWDLKISRKLVRRLGRMLRPCNLSAQAMEGCLSL